ncbi:methionine aminopeptidase 1D, mitochondrial isoform X2 [Chelonia mydas]|uniref:methionine aminopeptidase 1D, mitochondrial isoform X2 n=1 Tax=Chelonia mydas TaxID=8469 RepID=UPI0018A234A2|nr:methionine aminopeptidase 1D, mitochondrial isoform X2 [Chelonia mydas]
MAAPRAACTLLSGAESVVFSFSSTLVKRLSQIRRRQKRTFDDMFNEIVNAFGTADTEQRAKRISLSEKLDMDMASRRPVQESEHGVQQESCGFCKDSVEVSSRPSGETPEARLPLQPLQNGIPANPPGGEEGKCYIPSTQHWGRVLRVKAAHMMMFDRQGHCAFKDNIDVFFPSHFYSTVCPRLNYLSDLSVSICLCNKSAGPENEIIFITSHNRGRGERESTGKLRQQKGFAGDRNPVGTARFTVWEDTTQEAVHSTWSLLNQVFKASLSCSAPC